MLVRPVSDLHVSQSPNNEERNALYIHLRPRGEVLSVSTNTTNLEELTMVTAIMRLCLI